MQITLREGYKAMERQDKLILIVDDDADILTFVRAMLEDEGYLVITADKINPFGMPHNGRLPDLILLDMLLSGNDGRDIIQQLKRQEQTRHIPIILFSAHPTAEKEAEIAGANDFLGKPFEMDELLVKVANYLD